MKFFHIKYDYFSVKRINNSFLRLIMMPFIPTLLASAQVESNTSNFIKNGQNEATLTFVDRMRSAAMPWYVRQQEGVQKSAPLEIMGPQVQLSSAMVALSIMPQDQYSYPEPDVFNAAASDEDLFFGVRQRPPRAAPQVNPPVPRSLFSEVIKELSNHSFKSNSDHSIPEDISAGRSIEIPSLDTVSEHFNTRPLTLEGDELNESLPLAKDMPISDMGASNDESQVFLSSLQANAENGEAFEENRNISSETGKETIKEENERTDSSEVESSQYMLKQEIERHGEEGPEFVTSWLTRLVNSQDKGEEIMPTAQEVTEIKKWFQTKAEAGNADAQYVLETIYCEGEQYSIEERQLSSFALQGHIEIQFILGIMLCLEEREKDAYKTLADEWVEQELKKIYGHF